MDKTDFNVYFFKYRVDLQGNYIHLINVGGLFLRFVSYIVVPNMSHFTFYMLHIISHKYIVFKLLFIKQKSSCSMEICIIL